MSDLELKDNQIQIFCTFIVGFGTLRETVKEMALSKEKGGDQQRAVKICEIITGFLSGGSSIESVIYKIDVPINNPKVAGLVKFVRVQLKSKDDFYVNELKQQLDWLKKRSCHLSQNT